MEELKKFQPKTTLHLPALLQLYPEKVHSTTLQKYSQVATQTFDDNQTSSIFWINITKTNMKQDTLRLQQIVIKKKESSEVTISRQIQARNGNESTFSPGYHCFSTAGFKKIDSFIFQELIFTF